MTRIIAGSAGGRRLATLPGELTRPTSDRVREAIFSALEARFGSLQGVRFLDLYAGTGAMGLEAASRGASAVVCVEQDKRTAALIRRNASAVALDLTLHALPVMTALARIGSERFDVIFADPPYPLESARVDELLAMVAGQQRLAEGGVCLIERSKRSARLTLPSGWSARTKRYGETELWFCEPLDPNLAEGESS